MAEQCEKGGCAPVPVDGVVVVVGVVVGGGGGGVVGVVSPYSSIVKGRVSIP
jgi:hypothetical protein